MNITLITPTQGNTLALKRTIDSLKGIIDEVVIGSVCIYPEDEKIIESYGEEISMKLLKFPFEFIFKNGFSAILNQLAAYASNDWCIYLNVGEILIKGKDEFNDRFSKGYNSYYIDHPTEKHHWYRVYNKKELRWSGIIHEELVGNYKSAGFPLFTFDDTPKDKEGEPYWDIMNALKECVYWNQYLKLADQSHLIGKTNQGWVQFAHDGYNGFIERLHKKGDMYDAFLLGDKELLMDYISKNF